MVRFSGLSSLRRNLSLSEWSLQYLIGVTGVPLGTIAYLLLGPSAEVLVNRSIWSIFLQVIFLTVFGAILEEIIFRGLLRHDRHLQTVLVAARRVLQNEHDLEQWIPTHVSLRL